MQKYDMGRVWATSIDAIRSPTLVDIFVFMKRAIVFSLQSGTIFVVDQLGRAPIEATYELEIEAIDSTKPAFHDTAKVFVNVPKNRPPRITGPSEIHVAENLAIGTTIGRILATDPDHLPSDRSPLIFSILDRKGWLTPSRSPSWLPWRRAHAHHLVGIWTTAKCS
jgi:hypothetical protein